jgi:hypothetical protein
MTVTLPHTPKAFCTGLWVRCNATLFSCDRAARVAQRECTAGVRSDVEPPIKVPIRVPSPMPKPPDEGSRFDAIWNNLASRHPSSPLGVTSLTEPAVRATPYQISEPAHEPAAAPSLSPSTEQIAESDVVKSREPTSSMAMESAEAQQEPSVIVIPPSTGKPAQINDLKPVPPPKLAPVLPTGSQIDNEDPQASFHAQTAEADEPTPAASPLLPPETPRSSILRAMVGLLRTGLRRFEGHAARH